MKTILSILTVSLLVAAPAFAGENCAKACDKATATACEKAKATECSKTKASSCEKHAALRKALLTHKGAYLAKR